MIIKRIIFIIFLLFSMGCTEKPRISDGIQEVVVVVSEDPINEIFRINSLDPTADRIYTIDDSNGNIKITVPDHGKSPLLKFVSPSGKEAIIDFLGDKIIYSGELGVDESAKLFFTHYKYYLDEWCRNNHPIVGVNTEK